MTRRTRRSGFGYIISKGTTSHPAFVIRWYEGAHRKQKSGFTTRTGAAEGLARVRTGLGDGTLVTKRRAVVGFDEVAKEWLKLHSKPNLRSHEDNQERYTKHVAPFFGDTPLNAITPARILELRAKLQAQLIARKHRDADGDLHTTETKMASRTVNLVMALVRSILRFAVVNGHIAASPTDRVGRGKLMVAIEKTKLAPPIEHAADVGRLLAAIRDIGEETRRPGLYPLFALLAYTGARRGEAVGLRWADVDVDRRMLTIRRSYEGITKSGKQRTVPLPTVLVTILKAYKLADPWKGALVFPNDDGEMYSSNSKLQSTLHAALERIGLPRIRLHDLRHVYASHFVMSGGDIFTLQRILGHSTPQLTSDTYAHLSPAHMAGEADRVAFPEPSEAAKVLAFGTGTISPR
jgi:integrase